MNYYRQQQGKKRFKTLYPDCEFHFAYECSVCNILRRFNSGCLGFLWFFQEQTNI